MSALDGKLSDAQFEALTADPSKLNPPEALAQALDMGISEDNAKKQLGLDASGGSPAVKDDDAVVEDGAAEGAVDDGTGAASGTAGEEPLAPASDDPVVKSAKLEAENAVWREVFKAMPHLAGKPAEPVRAAEPPPKPPEVAQWERLSGVSATDARAYVERLTADGNTFEAGRFQAAWESAPSHLQNWKRQEDFRQTVETQASAVRQTQVDAEITALAKSHPDWEKYAEQMEVIAANDRAATLNGGRPAYKSVEDVYWAARGVVDRGVAPTGLSPAAAAKKAALGKGPGSKRGGTGVPGVGAKPDPEQTLIRSLLTRDTTF